MISCVPDCSCGSYSSCQQIFADASEEEQDPAQSLIGLCPVHRCALDGRGATRWGCTFIWVYVFDTGPVSQAKGEGEEMRKETLHS